MSGLQLTKDAEQLSCLLIPMIEGNMLLPNVSVAEVIQFEMPTKAEEKPYWFLGEIQWRNTAVPLISYESYTQQQAVNVKRNARIAILNTVNPQAKQAFYAMLVQGIPKLIKLSEQDVSAESTVDLPDSVKMQVKTELGFAFIPDLPYIEQLVESVL